VVVEREHHHAVCRGQFAQVGQLTRPSVNVSFLKRGTG
jgi:hypothetical protein